jgi:hypothetical protein
MYLVDTNVISEARKGLRANPGVRAFFVQAMEEDWPHYLSAISIGELRRGVDLIRHRGDGRQADALEAWLTQLLQDYGDRVLVWIAMQPNSGDGCGCPTRNMRWISRSPQSRCSTT